MGFMSAMGLQGEFYDLVVEATTEVDGDANWAKVIEASDVANLKQQNAKEILKDVTKRVKSADEGTRRCTLVLLESLFKNGGRSIHQLVSAADDLLRQIATIAADAKQTNAASVTQARRLVLALHLFSHGRRDLRGLSKIASSAELEEYRKNCETDDWRQVTGPGTAGIKSDPRSYQEISPRASTEPHVVAPVEAHPEASAPGHDASPRPLPAEIQVIWDRIDALKQHLADAEEAGGGVRGDADVAKMADELRGSKPAVNNAAEVGTNPNTTQQLRELYMGITDILEEYARLNAFPRVLSSKLGASYDVGGAEDDGIQIN